MNVDLVKEVLLWCIVINYAVLFLWFGAFVFAHGWMLKLHGRWLRMSEERFNGIHCLGMTVYKSGILLFNLVPYIAPRIASHHAG